MEEQNNEKLNSRRELLKKTAKFVIPTLITFQVSALQVAASGSRKFADPFRTTPRGDVYK